MQPKVTSVLAEAQAQVARTKMELEVARDIARRKVEARNRIDWLSDRPDLARLDQLIQEIPSRKKTLELAQKEYDKKREELLNEKIKTSLIVPHELEKRIALSRWLFEKLKVATTETELKSLLNEPQLDEANKAIITARIESLRTNVGWISFESIRESSSSSPVFYPGHTPNCWNVYKQLVNEQLQSAEQERNELLREHLPCFHSDVEATLGALKAWIKDAQTALCESNAALPRQWEIDRHISRRKETSIADQTRDKQVAHNLAIQHLQKAQIEESRISEQKKRDWWRAVDEQPIEAIVQKLNEAPYEFIDKILQRLLKMDTADPHILNEQVHFFLEENFHRLVRFPRLTAPLIVAQIGFLIGKREDAKASKLLNLFPTDGLSGLAGLVAYLRFVVSKSPNLTGVTCYDSLSAEDLFLGACYYGEGVASSTLKQQSNWDYRSLESALSNSNENTDCRFLHDFKVRGLQPRIAELALRVICERFRGAKAAAKMRDLNREWVESLAKPWSLNSQRILPVNDWKDVNGNQYDVKSNLYYRSKQKKIGLCGFLINLSATKSNSFPGFVFTDTTDEYCSEWHGHRPQVLSAEGVSNRWPTLLDCFSAQECRNYIQHAGYHAT
jgi:hypothetical protein